MRNDQTAELVSGDYVVRFEPRTLDDIRAMGGNSEEDERRLRRSRGYRKSISVCTVPSCSLG